jgi:sulfoxide reductase heme-binding subunit YedZ
MLGLFAFFYLGLHFLVYLVLDQFFDWHTIVKDIAKRPYITVGFTGLLLLVPLAVTSTKGWVRRLGRRWVPLHALIYVTALAGIVHFTWSQKKDITRPTRYGVVLVVLLGARLVPRGALRRRASAPQPRGAVVPSEPPRGAALDPPGGSRDARAGRPLVPGDAVG